MDKQPDELILQSLRQGSYDAFDALYMRYAPHVEAFAFCMLKNRSEAEDLAHDIFLKIWETRESIGRIKSFRSYLFRMKFFLIAPVFSLFRFISRANSCLSRLGERRWASLAPTRANWVLVSTIPSRAGR